MSSKADKAKLAAGAEAIHKAELEAKAKRSWRDRKKVHPAADAFPLMDQAELRKLADDIQANGIRVPIQTRTAEDGQLYVIDGRNRLDACELLGWRLIDDKGEWHGQIKAHIEYKRKDHKEIVAEIISYNIQRRHLTKQDQVALIDAALRATNDFATMARSFRPVPDKKGGSTRDEHKAAVVEQAAKVGISERTVERALAKRDGLDTPAPVPKAKRRKAIFPKVSRFKKAVTSLKNAILWTDVKDSNGKWVSEILIDLSKFLTRRAAALVKGRPTE